MTKKMDESRQGIMRIDNKDFDGDESKNTD